MGFLYDNFKATVIGSGIGQVTLWLQVVFDPLQMIIYNRLDNQIYRGEVGDAFV